LADASARLSARSRPIPPSESAAIGEEAQGRQLPGTVRSFLSLSRAQR
jgi:hypothetical protein